MKYIPKLSLLLLFILSVCAKAMAEVVEENVALPDELGTATLYYNDDAVAKTAGVIVVHEWWGLNQYAKDRARMLADLGYTAIAVDMYGHGKVAEHPNDAKGFMDAAMANPEKVNARFNAAKNILKEQVRVDQTKVYAMGYCFGGAVVLNQARMGNDLAGVASFHGNLSAAVEAKPSDVKARILVAHGGADPFVPADQVTGFVEEMLSLGADFQLLNYPQAKHSFTNPGATTKGEKYNLPLAYDEDADTKSWRAFLDFIEG